MPAEPVEPKVCWVLSFCRLDVVGELPRWVWGAVANRSSRHVVGLYREAIALSPRPAYLTLLEIDRDGTPWHAIAVDGEPPASPLGIERIDPDDCERDEYLAIIAAVRTIWPEYRHTHGAAGTYIHIAPRNGEHEQYRGG